MPYYSGSANSFADIRTALFAACVDNGWSNSGTILTKGTAALNVENNTVSTANKGIGLLLQGGTSVSAGALVNPSPVTPRMGPPMEGTSMPTWPMEYNIFIFENPDEVYLVARFNVDFYLWLAFGLSDISDIGGTGLWLSATAPANNNAGSGGGLVITATSGGGGGSASGAPFWNSSPTISFNHRNQDTIHLLMDGVTWAGQPATNALTGLGAFNAFLTTQPLLARQPNAWNGEAILLRILGLFWRNSDKCSVVCDLKNARYVRIDNYTPGQIITLGSDQWKIFPFYRKNTTERNGSNSGIDHTGTFGWAIRYEGP